MAAPATASPQDTVTSLFRSMDALDMDGIKALMADEVQGVDELSGGWRRGRRSLEEYLDVLAGSGLSDIRSSLGDLHTTEWGDTAVVTGVLEQSYRAGEASVSLRAPTTIVLRRHDGAWRVALVHSVPLPEEGGQS
jgi:ketosteroid isomerase-like protein